MRARRCLLAILVTAGLAATPAPARAWDIAVVGVAGDPRAAVSHDELTQIYRRRQRIDAWGRRVVPVNLPAQDPVRLAFSQLVYGRLPEELADYWNEQYFHGVEPPHVVESAEAMRRFVQATPGAIGYLPACMVDARVEVLALLTAPPASPPPETCREEASVDRR